MGKMQYHESNTVKIEQNDFKIDTFKRGISKTKIKGI